MAFDLAIKNDLARPFLVQQGTAGWKWLRKFMCRRPRLRLRKPQVTSAARVKGFTKAKVAKFFDIFELITRSFSSHRLFIYDETGLTVVQNKVCKVFSFQGKQWVSFSPAEKGSFVTIVTRNNATVRYVAHLLVFSRSNMKAELLDSTPPSSTAACHKPGWIQI
jgi:hypothetical protein